MSFFPWLGLCDHMPYRCIYSTYAWITVVFGNCLLLSSLVLHFLVISFSFFPLFGLLMAPVGALWTQKVVYVENNPAWGF